MPKAKTKAIPKLPKFPQHESQYEYKITLRDVMNSIEKINEKLSDRIDRLSDKMDRDIKSGHRWIIGLVLGMGGLILLNSGLILIKLFMG